MIMVREGLKLDDYTVILEPCTTRPISVNEAAAHGWCSRLAPGAALTTQVTVRAGRLESSHP